MRGRHILLDSEEAAVAAIERLDGGEVFISLATELSQGPSAARGGDLGYFHPSRMPPDFAGAALALEPGQYTRAPVRTEFGWHIILLVDRRADDIPSRSEEHTSELQSLMRISYAVFCLKNKNTKPYKSTNDNTIIK